MTIPELWLPIVTSAVAVWVLSAVVWTALPHHKSDYAALPDEDAARTALADVPPGLYAMPYDPDHSLAKTPEGRQKFDDGPVAMLTFCPKGVPTMGVSLVSWFAFCLFIAVMIAYVLTRALPPTAGFHEVWQIASTVGWLAYGTGNVQRSVWFGEPWSVTLKHLADALLYGLVAGAIFAGLW